MRASTCHSSPRSVTRCTLPLGIRQHGVELVLARLREFGLEGTLLVGETRVGSQVAGHKTDAYGQYQEYQRQQAAEQPREDAPSPNSLAARPMSHRPSSPRATISTPSVTMRSLHPGSTLVERVWNGQFMRSAGAVSAESAPDLAAEQATPWSLYSKGVTISSRRDAVQAGCFSCQPSVTSRPLRSMVS